MSRERVYLLLLLQFIRHPIWVASSGGSGSERSMHNVGPVTNLPQHEKKTFDNS